MKFGINTLLWSGGFSSTDLYLFPKVKELGFDAIEVARFDFSDSALAPALRQAAADSGLELIVCSALTGRMSLVAEETAAQAAEFLEHAVRWTAEAGSTIFVGPFCSPVGYLPGRRRTAEEWDRAVEQLRALTPVLDETGVTLAIEPLNRFETFFLNTAADARALCEAVGHRKVGILFDTFHANIEEKSLAGSLAKAGPWIRHIHACENDRAAPGTGHVPFGELFEWIRATGYDGRVVIESFGSTIPEIAAAACIWRDLASSPEALAADGLRFLKQH